MSGAHWFPPHPVIALPHGRQLTHPNMGWCLSGRSVHCAVPQSVWRRGGPAFALRSSPAPMTSALVQTRPVAWASLSITVPFGLCRNDLPLSEPNVPDHSNLSLSILFPPFPNSSSPLDFLFFYRLLRNRGHNRPPTSASVQCRGVPSRTGVRQIISL